MDLTWDNTSSIARGCYESKPPRKDFLFKNVCPRLNYIHTKLLIPMNPISEVIFISPSKGPPLDFGIKIGLRLIHYSIKKKFLDVFKLTPTSHNGGCVVPGQSQMFSKNGTP